MAVNGVSFRGALDSAKDILNQPQAQTRPQSGQGAPTGPAADELVKPKKKHGVRNGIIGTLVAAAVVVGGLVAGHKMGGFTKLVEKAAAEGAGGFAKFAGKMGGYAETAGKFLTDNGVKAWNAVKGIFKKAPDTAA